jgi:DNA recombination protein RmuC
MEYYEILIIVNTVLLGVVLIGQWTTKKAKEYAPNDVKMKEALNGLEKNFRSEIQQSFLRFNTSLTEQLISLQKQSGEDISEFRLKVNDNLIGFQEKMTDRFNQEFKTLTQAFQTQMSQINHKVEERLDKGFRDANATFIDIARRVEVIDHAQKNIKKLSEEMVSLQTILSNNQSRGAFGEYQLNQLLASVYGQNNQLYQTQYTIQTDQKSVRVDAVVFMPKPNAMIAIDSKFPYASYAKLFSKEGVSKEEEQSLISQFGREVKKHITDVSIKYISPPQTTDYAIMFVPSDGILSLLHAKLQNVVQYAREKNVTIVSPTTIVPLLSSFKAFVIDYERSKNMEKINQELMKLGRDFKLFDQEWKKLNRAIQTVKKDSDTMDSRIDKMTSKFEQIKDVGVIEEDGQR